MKTLFVAVIVCIALLGAAAGSVHAAPPSPVDVASIDIVPASVSFGQQPTITARIARTKAELPLEPASFTIIAVVTLPDKVTKSWTVQNVPFGRGESKEFLLPRLFETKLAGEYRVEYNVYSGDMRRRLASRSKTFTAGVAAPAQPEAPKEPPVAVKKEEPRHPEKVLNTMGIGLYGNALPNAGGTVLLWPYEHLGLQASYTVGTFTSLEVRLLARFNPVWKVRPYVGVGYVNVTKNEDVIGVSTDFKDSSISGVIGAELPLGRRWFIYAEAIGASIDLQQIVTNGGQTVKATVDYPAVTVGAGVVYYLF